jgi:cell filamentation protein
MDDNTNWTPFPEDNSLVNEYEAKGIAMAELFVFELDIEIQITTTLILEIHKIAFNELYDWAGQWRKTQVIVGQLVPPPPTQVIQAMYQFIDNLNFKISIAENKERHIECFVFAHYEFIKIHPFNNGNGRTGRILMNLVAMKLGYQPLELYYRDGESRKAYIDAMKSGDKGDYSKLTSLITKELTPF